MKKITAFEAFAKDFAKENPIKQPVTEVFTVRPYRVKRNKVSEIIPPPLSISIY
jgi:hypothetical protein